MTIDLINPQNNIGVKNWNIVNDDVMGGISRSNLSINDENNLMFSGYLSLENNGGFASSRLSIKKKNLKGVKSFKLKIKGDGNIYKLRLRQDYRRASYSCDFKSLENKWIEISLPIENFEATWRGYSYSDYPDLDIEKINSLGIQISDKQEGEFELEIKYIKAVY
tara:strand:- start:511 stop:1005 length:495 start_codon:yes stop_codon:yes gene_type:complete